MPPGGCGRPWLLAYVLVWWWWWCIEGGGREASIDCDRSVVVTKLERGRSRDSKCRLQRGANDSLELSMIYDYVSMCQLFAMIECETVECDAMRCDAIRYDALRFLN